MMRQFSIVPLIAFFIMLSAFKNGTDKSKGHNTMPPSNPFSSTSSLPYQAPDFTKIKDADFKPAFEEGMKVQMSEIEKIAANTKAPTFENTLVAMEKSGQLLT